MWTTSLFAEMSGLCAEGNTFQVLLDGVLQPNSRFNTSAWQPGEVQHVPLFAALSANASYSVAIVKDTEPQFAGTAVKPNAVTFHGFSGDSSAARLVAPPHHGLPQPHRQPQRRMEFLGDSITAGFDNQCDIPGAPRGFPWSESFMQSWATRMCDDLGAECHYTAWSGFGMVSNCCGGATLGPDVWARTLATVGSANASDPHGTTATNAWDFGKWTPDAVVINLGTNDHLGTNTSSAKAVAFTDRYTELVMAASAAYSNATRFFLACGPMSSDYCPEVSAVVARVAASGVEAHLLNQVGFDDGTHGKTCAYGHPGSQIDAAMAKNGSAYIKSVMRW